MWTFQIQFAAFFLPAPGWIARVLINLAEMVQIRMIMLIRTVMSGSLYIDTLVMFVVNSHEEMQNNYCQHHFCTPPPPHPSPRPNHHHHQQHHQHHQAQQS